MLAVNYLTFLCVHVFQYTAQSILQHNRVVVNFGDEFRVFALFRDPNERHGRFQREILVSVVEIRRNYVVELFLLVFRLCRSRIVSDHKK